QQQQCVCACTPCHAVSSAASLMARLRAHSSASFVHPAACTCHTCSNSDANGALDMESTLWLSLFARCPCWQQQFGEIKLRGRIKAFSKTAAKNDCRWLKVLQTVSLRDVGFDGADLAQAGNRPELN
ncbi:unnamed protein product, partial [Polarella glacialis]